VSTEDSGHSSHPSQASRPAGCRVTSPLHSAAFHLLTPLIAALPFVPLVCLAGCHVSSFLTPHPATSHLLAPPPLIAPSPLVTPLSGLLSSWLRRPLSSRRRHISVV